MEIWGRLMSAPYFHMFYNMQNLASYGSYSCGTIICTQECDRKHSITFQCFVPVEEE